MKRQGERFTSEAALCVAFIADVRRNKDWTAYPETAGWDILLVRADGCQIGIEAKLALNVEVVSQALPRWHYDEGEGPDYRAVLVPEYAGGRMNAICHYLGITIILQPVPSACRLARARPELPGVCEWSEARTWHPWCPSKRAAVPDYVPDVIAGASAPLKLTQWKINAIRLAILLEERPVTRKEIIALGLSPQRWIDRVTGWLAPTAEGYVPSATMPDFRAMHPTNWQQIKADRDRWDITGRPT